MSHNDELAGYIANAMRVHNSYKKMIRDMYISLSWVALIMIFEIVIAVLAPNLKIKIVTLACFVLLAWHFGVGINMIERFKYERDRVKAHIIYLSSLLNKA
jgi:hypothetical protein